MKLSDLIKTLVEIATDVGECEVFLTTENEHRMYDTVLLHHIPFENTSVLRMEGIIDNGEDKEEDENN